MGDSFLRDWKSKLIREAWKSIWQYWGQIAIGNHDFRVISTCMFLNILV